jgi:chromatin remodeling complex protein RSC6
MTKKTSTKTKASKTTKAKTTKSVVQETAAQAPSTNQVATAPADAPPTVADQFTALLAQLSVLRSQVTSITSQVRTLSKNHEREIKAASKMARKKRKSGNRQPSGFVKPAVISDELAGFLGKTKGTEMARTEVTREINSYIRANKLQDPKNGRRILADGKLRKLLKLKKSDELTYFNLQRYMSPHFPKSGAAAKAAAAAKATATASA